MTRKKYKGLCVIDSVYTFFQFVLVNVKDYKEFFYVFWVNMPLWITEKLPNKLLLWDSYVAMSDPNKFADNWRYKLRFYWIMTKFRLWGLQVCGQDHLPFSRCLLNYTNKSFEEYEDGIGNYYHIEEVIDDKWRRRICAADAEPTFGFSRKVKRVYLTDENMPVPEKIAKKAKFVDLKEIWKKMSDAEKKDVMELFQMPSINVGKDIDTIVLTRPYSEDRMCTEEEKIDKLREILKDTKLSKVAIKPHYRERTDYKAVFPDVSVIEGKFPIELYMLMDGERIKRFITYGECSAEHFVKRYYPEIEYKRVD